MKAVTAFIVTMIVAAWAFTARAEDKELGQKHFKAGLSPLSKPLLMAPGDYEVAARLEGVEFGVETVRLLSGDEKRVALAGRDEPASPSPTTASTPSTPPPEDTRSPSPLFWAAAGGAVATGVLSGVFFGLRGRAEDDFGDARDEWDALTPAEQSSAVGDGPWSDMKSAGEDYDKWNAAGIGMAATAGALTAAAVIILIVDLGGDEEPPATDTARAAFRPAAGGLRIEF